MEMAFRFTTIVHSRFVALFRQYKKLAEGAMGQVRTRTPIILDPEMNSIALIVKHMAGNMRSRWTDFLTSDGEKPDRHRDSEFIDAPPDRGALMESVGERLGTRFRGNRTAIRRGSHPYDYHSRRSPFGHAGDQPANRSLCLPLRTNRDVGQALQIHRMEDS